MSTVNQFTSQIR